MTASCREERSASAFSARVRLTLYSVRKDLQRTLAVVLRLQTARRWDCRTCARYVATGALAAGLQAGKARQLPELDLGMPAGL